MSNVSRWGDDSRRHSLDPKAGGESPISNTCDVSPDLAENRRRLPGNHWDGVNSANPAFLSASSFRIVTGRLRPVRNAASNWFRVMGPPRSGETIAQSSIRYAPLANRIHLPSGDQTG